MNKYLKYGLYALLAALVVIQFIRPEKNQSADETFAVSTKFPVPEEVQAILNVACNDCHSNNTRYPWYSNFQPVAWWLADHVNDGKRHLNFSSFTSKPVAVQNHKMEEVIEQVKEGEMPLGSYTPIHRDAVLSDAQKALLTQWAQSVQDSLKARYPADSLVLKRRAK